ncbi:MAG: rod shape-determining protein MreD [Bacteroidales bacterium]|nr:rod shape-determining protein MreD [Bacteroidales bacterium]
MKQPVVKNIFRFFLLILLQVLVLDNVPFHGYIIPYVYVLFILLLPFQTNRSLLLFLAFVTGLVIDAFGNTLGLHAAALVFMAFLRPGVLRFYFPRLEADPNDEPGIAKLGFSGFLRYAFTLILFHQLTLTFLELFSFRHFFNTLYEIGLNAVITTLVVIVLELLFAKRKKRPSRR